MNCELPDVQAGFRKGRGPKAEIILPTSVGSSEKQESSRKTPTSALVTTPKPLTVWITTSWKILKEIGIPDHLACLLRNLYAGQEASVRTAHGTIDWFQTGKGVRQGCILSPCLFRQWHPTPVLLPGKSHGWRSLVGYSPWDRKESKTLNSKTLKTSNAGEHVQQ